MVNIICQECKKSTPSDHMYCIYCSKVPASKPAEPLKPKINWWGILVPLTFILLEFIFLKELKSLGMNSLIAFGLFFGSSFVIYYFHNKYQTAQKSYEQAKSLKCPKCGFYDSLRLDESADEIISSWGRWETRAFTDQTTDTKGQVISRTTRNQQVWVSYQEMQRTLKCSRCIHQETYTKTKSWVN